jgi:hypothetical protein
LIPAGYLTGKNTDNIYCLMKMVSAIQANILPVDCETIDYWWLICEESFWQFGNLFIFAADNCITINIL